MNVIESFPATRAAADSTTDLTNRRQLGCFICDTAGTLTLTINGTVVLSAMAVSAGSYYPLPFDIVGTSSLALAGGAAGAIGVI